MDTPSELPNQDLQGPRPRTRTWRSVTQHPNGSMRGHVIATGYSEDQARGRAAYDLGAIPSAVQMRECCPSCYWPLDIHGTRCHTDVYPDWI